jgi:hypothetical protein
MKLLFTSIGLLGFAQVTLWAWAPKVAHWQARNALQRYDASEQTLKVAAQVFQESMKYTYIEAGVVGALLVVSSVLLLRRLRIGWNLWLFCLGVICVSAVAQLVLGGLSAGLVMRLLLCSALALATYRIHRRGSLAGWFRESK